MYIHTQYIYIYIYTHTYVYEVPQHGLPPIGGGRRGLPGAAGANYTYL